ncbi:hypothetical protein [Inmirania thermothiophila]|uniref:Uncharacterized protein n=1 Tax=Inmirania thermothiophila TaxID=1750597 RepID=A0A3N1XWF8_9GAMM|nr:hypothetical protein [Inmirania thermothiophila]ROR29532.1 hypothetical protein EDC57_2202 [Inmirania thermothiophila]
MEPLATWEKVLLGVGALLLLLWFYPGLQALHRRAQEAPRDWPGFLLPLAAVVLVVLLLLASV